MLSLTGRLQRSPSERPELCVATGGTVLEGIERGNRDIIDIESMTHPSNQIALNSQK